MAKVGFSALTPSAVALVGGVPKTVLYVISTGLGTGIDLQKFQVSFDGTTIGNTPVFCEVTYCTGASNVNPGTGSTAATLTQEYGRVWPSNLPVAGAACTSEPTVQTPIKGFLLTPYAGLAMYDYSLGTTPDSAGSAGFCLRCTAPQAVNVRAELHFERM